MYSKLPSDVIFETLIFNSLLEDQMFALFVNFLSSSNFHNCDESKKMNKNDVFGPYLFHLIATHLMNMLHFVKQSHP